MPVGLELPFKTRGKLQEPISCQGGEASQKMLSWDSMLDKAFHHLRAAGGEGGSWVERALGSSPLQLASSNLKEYTFFFSFFFLFWPPHGIWNSRARGQIWATAVTYAATAATPDPLTHSAGPEIKPKSWGITGSWRHRVATNSMCTTAAAPEGIFFRLASSLGYT